MRYTVGLETIDPVVSEKMSFEKVDARTTDAYLYHTFTFGPAEPQIEVIPIACQNKKCR